MCRCHAQADGTRGCMWKNYLFLNPNPRRGAGEPTETHSTNETTWHKREGSTKHAANPLMSLLTKTCIELVKSVYKKGELKMAHSAFKGWLLHSGMTELTRVCKVLSSCDVRR